MLVFYLYKEVQGALDRDSRPIYENEREKEKEREMVRDEESASQKRRALRGMKEASRATKSTRTRPVVHVVALIRNSGQCLVAIGVPSEIIGIKEYNLIAQLLNDTL